MERTNTRKAVGTETAHTRKGRERRRFMARTIQELGPDGYTRAERELGWNRQMLRKALREVTSDLNCHDAVTLRGRKRAEAHLPSLLTASKAIVASQS